MLMVGAVKTVLLPKDGCVVPIGLSPKIGKLDLQE